MAGKSVGKQPFAHAFFMTSFSMPLWMFIKFILVQIYFQLKF